MISSSGAGLYEAYVASMEAARAHKKTCWRVIAYRADKFLGRWEIIMGTGRSMGPFDDPVSAMRAAIRENTVLIAPHTKEQTGDGTD